MPSAFIIQSSDRVGGVIFKFSNPVPKFCWKETIVEAFGKVDQDEDMALVMVLLAKARLCLKAMKFSNVGKDLKRDSARFLSLITWEQC
ncbi:hypothetical protein GWI33_020968 [Rhynchophorus ferrugineus]|uniref:Uncharacterized protein n=1 Tax=Rhynchophorus ferrugineus TaxID=354439 RepID=A0A834I297_RHYFE|nr:hypothetical protein GWI33_020968 [Rhynchophorus ferrugineus]